MMLSDVPNFAFVVGYTNASWTLKADLVCQYVVRVLQHMERTGTRMVVPRRDPDVREEPFSDMAAGYVLRAAGKFPQQGSKEPWRLKMNYFKDRRVFARPVTDPALEYSDPDKAAIPA
jgi:monooxygenase